MVFIMMCGQNAEIQMDRSLNLLCYFCLCGFIETELVTYDGVILWWESVILTGVPILHCGTDTWWSIGYLFKVSHVIIGCNIVCNSLRNYVIVTVVWNISYTRIIPTVSMDRRKVVSLFWGGAITHQCSFVSEEALSLESWQESYSLIVWKIQEDHLT